MKHILRFIFILSAVVLFASGTVYSSGFQVKTVGALNVDGVTYSQLWYSSGNVTFTGITPAGTDVTATIDGTSAAATVDAEGNWTHTTTLSDGDHNVLFSSSAGSKSFTLTIGPVPADVGALPQAQVPTVGTVTPTIIALIAGSVLVLLGIATSLRRLYSR